MDGILLVDKPTEWTSNDVCQYVKKKFRLKKVGHAGTLDPNASGLLVLLLNRMTKCQQNLVTDDKVYSGVIELGMRTTTLDTDGEVVERKDFAHISDESIIAEANKFIGTIQQTPPMVSAVKINGERLYKLARKGVTVEREKRTVQVYDLTIESILLPHINFNISVSKGFYVRSFADDLGAGLGCGGCLAALSRRRSGQFSIDNAITIDAIRSIKTIDDLKPFLVNYKTVDSQNYASN